MMFYAQMERTLVVVIITVDSLVLTLYLAQMVLVRMVAIQMAIVLLDIMVIIKRVHVLPAHVNICLVDAVDGPAQFKPIVNKV